MRGRPKRMWINQPSTMQPLHHLHGTNVLAVEETIYFLSGETISMVVPTNPSPLSEGWNRPSNRLVFSNADAKPKNVCIECSRDSVPHIMAWYGAYFAGDRYTVTFNGRDIRMDQNGEPV